MREHSPLPLIAALALAAPLAAPPAEAQQAAPLVIRDVSVIPMDREEVLPGQTVVIRDGRIESVGPAPARLPADAIAIDGSGKFLIPGLAEMHAHVGSPEANARILPLYALNGVTTARGMLGAPGHLALRDSLARGLVLGPRLLTSGPSFSGGSITPEEARRRVREQKEMGYDLLKIHPGPSRAAFDALAETAHEVGIPFAGHVPADVGLDRAIEAGYSTIDHLDGFMEALVPPGATGVPARGGWFGLNLVPHVDEGRIPRIVTRMREAGVAVVPTQTLMENYASDLTGDELAARLEYRYWPADQVEQWRASKNARLEDPDTPPAAQRARYIHVRRRLIRALYDGGVPVLLGSDAPQVWNVPGFAAHRELHLYVDAGLTPWQALRTGTVEIARHLGEEGRSGVIRPGARADLILLDANPLESIENTMRIAGVVVNGRWISGEERERRLAGLRTGGR
ncbi:MAG: amidohydrolase family protein [Gemmatimonadetes bacterium]|nr:amidohydrolase family protein [Gemmatimonadota bacterium]